ncbi:DUF3817 domain-containing protein [Pseudopedobacter beijingensis]|uniref:DUF3817 domain-containing protein n=1 Tax=Pseudopedobacter beijingensis TaxID=1207056 RepID=A0ABW4ICI2_9SPHI
MNTDKLLQNFRFIAYWEGWSYLAIFVTMIFKYVFKMGTANFIVGSVHGILFILYVILLFLLLLNKRINITQALIGFIVSLIPFGTFYADKKWFSKW